MANRKIDVNTADVNELESLSGVGHAKAEAIVDARKKLGGFSGIDDIVKVPGIGRHLLELNRNHLTCSAKKTNRKSPRKAERGRRRHSKGDSDDVLPSTSSDKAGRSRRSSEKKDDQPTPLISDQEDEANNDNDTSHIHQVHQCEVTETPRCRTRRSGSANAKPENISNVARDIKQELDEEYDNNERKSNDEVNKEGLQCLRSRNTQCHGSSDKIPMKRKSDGGGEDKGSSPGKKPCRNNEHKDDLMPAPPHTHNFGTIKTSSASQLRRTRIPSRSNPPPELAEWLRTFQNWSHAERLMALDEVVSLCEPTQVRHVMSVIEPQFQRDFIYLLPKELALYVLSFLEPKDLLRAAQTCRYWRILAEDNLLWREKCKEEGITPNTLSTSPILPQASASRVRRKSSTYSLASVTSSLSSGSSMNGDMPAKSQWKALYMRQYQIEQNWRHGSVRPHKVLKGHDDHVITCLEFSGNRIVSGSDDNTLKVWSALTGKCLRTLVGHTGGVWSSQMCGNIIISGSTDRTLKVWNADTGQCIHTLYGHTSTVRCMHLHENVVVSGSRDATLRMWDIDNGQCLHVLMGHVAAVRCVQYDGRRVVSGAYDYMVKVWDPETETCLHTLQGHTNRVYSLQFDGKHIVSGSLDTSIRVWDVDSGNCLHTLIGHQSLTSGMELKNNILVSGNADSTVKVWDITTGQCLQTLQGSNKHQSAVTCLQFNKKFVITSSDDGTVKIWDLKTGDFLRNLVSLDSGGSGGVVWRVRCSNTKLVCAVGSRNGTEETKLLVFDFDVAEDGSSTNSHATTLSSNRKLSISST